MNERAISVKQALACEAAIEPRCRCRCGGLLHGRAKAQTEKALSELPAEDPHFVKPEKDTFLRKEAGKMKTAALYARVSTKKQDNETQLRQLREYAERRGLVAGEYVDVISSSKERRPSLERLMADARLRLIDVVIVARFDRFARSTRELLTALEEFQALGVHFISLSESIDTSTPAGKLVFVVLGAVAELERNIIRERVQAGVDRARAKGKQLGRPKRIVDREKVQRLRGEGFTLADIARVCSISIRTVHRLVGKKSGKSPLQTFATSDSFQTDSPEPPAGGKNK